MSSFKRHRIFASGVHKNELDPVWPPERVQALFEATREHSPARIPYTYRHPENNLPVLGFTERESVQVLEEHGRTYLTAHPADFAKEWIASLKKSGFDRVSIGIGKLGEIVHIGITDNPAVSGLGLAFEAVDTVAPVFTSEVEFEAEELGVGEHLFEVSWKWPLGDWMQSVASIFQKMRDREIEISGADAAEAFLPSYVIDFLKKPLPEEDLVPVVDGANMTDNQQFEADMSIEEKAELDRLRIENAALLQRQAEADKLKVQREITAFCDEHATVVTPKIRNVIAAVLSDLHGAQPRQFEVGGKTGDKTSYDALKELIAGSKPALVFEDVATKDNAPESEASAGDPVLDVLTAQFEAAKQTGSV